MKTLREFKDYFERELGPDLVKFQAERDAARPHIWRWLSGWSLMLLLVMPALLTAMKSMHQWWATVLRLLILLPVFVVPVIIFMRYNGWKKKYGDQEKAQSLARVIRFLVPELDCQPGRHVPEKRVRASQIFRFCGDIVAMDGDDCFKGKIGGTAVEFSEVWVETTARYVEIDSKTTKLLQPKYVGLFLVADFNKTFQHATQVAPVSLDQLKSERFAENAATNSGSAIQIGGSKQGAKAIAATAMPGLDWQQIHLEDLVFGQAFEVYCTNRIEAHYILTPNIMERLVALKKRARFPFTLSFVDNAMHAFFHCGPLFEGNLDVDVTKFEAYQIYYEQLSLVFDLVEAMRLNTRLWAKV